MLDVLSDRDWVGQLTATRLSAKTTKHRTAYCSWLRSIAKHTSAIGVPRTAAVSVVDGDARVTKNFGSGGRPSPYAPRRLNATIGPRIHPFINDRLNEVIYVRISF